MEGSPEIQLSTEKYSLDCIEAVLTYIYSSYIPNMTLDLGCQLLCAAKELQVIGLKDYTVERMLNLPLCFGSAILFYKFGVSIDSIPVKSAAIKYFQR